MLNKCIFDLYAVSVVGNSIKVNFAEADCIEPGGLFGEIRRYVLVCTLRVASN